MCHRQDSFMKLDVPQARLNTQNVPQEIFWLKFLSEFSQWLVVCPINVVCNSSFTLHSSESYLFNENKLINHLLAFSMLVCPTVINSRFGFFSYTEIVFFFLCVYRVLWGLTLPKPVDRPFSYSSGRFRSFSCICQFFFDDVSIFKARLRTDTWSDYSPAQVADLSHIRAYILTMEAEADFLQM